MAVGVREKLNCQPPWPPILVLVGLLLLVLLGLHTNTITLRVGFVYLQKAVGKILLRMRSHNSEKVYSPETFRHHF